LSPEESFGYGARENDEPGTNGEEDG